MTVDKKKHEAQIVLLEAVPFVTGGHCQTSSCCFVETDGDDANQHRGENERANDHNEKEDERCNPAEPLVVLALRVRVERLVEHWVTRGIRRTAEHG